MKMKDMVKSQWNHESKVWVSFGNTVKFKLEDFETIFTIISFRRWSTKVFSLYIMNAKTFSNYHIPYTLKSTFRGKPLKKKLSIFVGKNRRATLKWSATKKRNLVQMNRILLNKTVFSNHTWHSLFKSFEFWFRITM